MQSVPEGAKYYVFVGGAGELKWEDDGMTTICNFEMYPKE